MDKNGEKLPIDARLLSDAIIELNISRRNVAIYPADHPAVSRSLDRAYTFMTQLFELRPRITIGIAKDTLIIDEHYLDKKNPVFREFATHLSGLGISLLTFSKGLTKEEIYTFHRFLSGISPEASIEEIKKTLNSHNLKCISLHFVDYEMFTFEEGKTEAGRDKRGLWERYLYGLLEGTLTKQIDLDEMRKIPPEVLASMLNRKEAATIKEESYERVITSYIRSSSERFFSDAELKKLLDFIHSLRPELKKQFLSTTVKNISTDLVPMKKALEEVSINRVMDLLNIVNEHKIRLPEALKNLIDKFAKIDGKDRLINAYFENSPILDDILLSPDIINLLTKGDFQAFVTDKYQSEIQKILAFEPGTLAREEMEALREACEFESLEREFSLLILDLIGTDTLSTEELEKQIPHLFAQCQHLVDTGQYGEAHDMIEKIELIRAGGTKLEALDRIIEQFQSAEFITHVVGSFRIMGRLMRDEAARLSSYYGKKIIPYLFDALIEEESKATRRFIITLITAFGKDSVAEAVNRIDDDRWFVKRNMIFILRECGDSGAAPIVKPYCRHENLQVSTEAFKCLLERGDEDAAKAVVNNLRSHSREIVNQAISLAGTFRIKEAVPELSRMLMKKGVTGADYLDKIPIVSVLGKIGEPEAIPALRHLVFSKSILFKSAIESLREEIFKTLNNYPLDAVLDLTAEGLHSKNEVIRSVSMKLMKSKRKNTPFPQGGHHGNA